MTKLRKIIILFLITVSMITSTACEQKENTEVYSGKSIANSDVQTEKPEALEILTDKTNFSGVSGNQEYHPETDHQYWFSDNLPYYDCAETDRSIYFLMDSKLYVFDKKTNEYAILCSDPSCSHTYDSGCSAIICSNTTYYLNYYNGYLYTLSADTEKEEQTSLLKEYLKLYRISLDGNQVDEVCTLASAVKTNGAQDNTFTVYGMAMHRGYLYYMYSYGCGNDRDTYYANNSNVLYRIALDGNSEPECICPMEYGGTPNLVSIQGHGSYLYFIRTGEAAPIDGGTLYRLNTETQKLEYIDIGWISFYQISENKIIYFRHTEQKYYYCDTDTWETSVFYEPGQDDQREIGLLVYDSKYYNILRRTEDNWKMTIYTPDMKKLCENDWDKKSKSGTYCEKFISPNYDFFSSGDGKELYYRDKSKLPDGIDTFIYTELID